MSKPKFVLVAHMGHDAPWLQIKPVAEIRERRAYIETNKPEHERPLRLKLLKIVKEPLPTKLAKVHAAWEKAYAARVKAYAAWVKADAARVKVDAARVKAYAARVKANAAWVKANAARVKADAAWEKAYAAWKKVDAAWVGADEAWGRAVVSREGVAFHKKVCGCAWTPEQPDILLQLAT